jgi:hypothetical protein
MKYIFSIGLFLMSFGFIGCEKGQIDIKSVVPSPKGGSTATVITWSPDATVGPFFGIVVRSKSSNAPISHGQCLVWESYMVQPREIVWIDEETIRPKVFSDARSYFWSVESEPCGRYSAQPMLVEEVSESLVPSARRQ